MPSRKIVRARKPGWCDSEFAHPSQINPGDRTMVTVLFPSDEFGPGHGQPPVRYRRCQWCVEDIEERERVRNQT